MKKKEREREKEKERGRSRSRERSRGREGKENCTISSKIVVHTLKLILNGVWQVIFSQLNSSLLQFET